MDAWRACACGLFVKGLLKYTLLVVLCAGVCNNGAAMVLTHLAILVIFPCTILSGTIESACSVSNPCHLGGEKLLNVFDV